jgi:D-3-phosphoglycerate dehydrogenase / 2-oxoglutarate reductase
MNILVTCPPMIGMKEALSSSMEELGWKPHYAKTRQVMSEEELMAELPAYDGWIIGDDPATRRVIEAGKAGNLKAAVKWGVGTDNVDFEACEDLGIAVANTPGMFGREVADIAVTYLIGLFRQTYRIDREVRNGNWPKYAGRSLADKRIGIVGLGDIGRQLIRRLDAMDCRMIGYDPGVEKSDIEIATWPQSIDRCDAIVFCCALTETNRHMFNSHVLNMAKSGVRIVNAARGPLLEEAALVAGLESGQIHSAALDVFEEEPIRDDSPLFRHENCIFGSHNASNTQEAVIRTSEIAIDILDGFLQ